MKRFEVVVFVDAPSLREARKALLQTVEYGYDSPMEYVREIAASLKEVKREPG